LSFGAAPTIINVADLVDRFSVTSRARRVRRPSAKSRKLSDANDDDDDDVGGLLHGGEQDNTSDEFADNHNGEEAESDDDDDDDDDEDDDEDEDDGNDDNDGDNNDNDDNGGRVGVSGGAGDDDASFNAQRRRRRSGQRSTVPTTVKRVPPPNFGVTPLVLDEGETDVQRWRPRACQHCGVDLTDACPNGACAVCCDSRTGRECVSHGRFALAVRRQATAAEAEADATANASTMSYYSEELLRFVCSCGSEWPTQKSFAGHCGQCEAWKIRHAPPVEPALRPRPYTIGPPFDGASGQAELLHMFPGASDTDAQWRSMVDDYAAFPHLRALMVRHTSVSLVAVLNATQLRLYIERCGLQAGPTLAERRRQLRVLADANDSFVGLAVLSAAQPRWVCVCKRQFAFDVALARHAVQCSEWEPLPCVRGIDRATVELALPAAICGQRQPVREFKEHEAMRVAAQRAETEMHMLQSALIETRLACLHTLYSVPVRSALTHIATLLAKDALPASVRAQLTDLRAKINPLYDMMTSPVTRSKSSAADLENCEFMLRHWLTALCSDPTISGMMADHFNP
jgi:hypothetical protein